MRPALSSSYNIKKCRFLFFVTVDSRCVFFRSRLPATDIAGSDTYWKRFISRLDMQYHVTGSWIGIKLCTTNGGLHIRQVSSQLDANGRTDLTKNASFWNYRFVWDWYRSCCQKNSADLSQYEAYSGNCQTLSRRRWYFGDLLRIAVQSVIVISPIDLIKSSHRAPPGSSDIKHFLILWYFHFRHWCQETYRRLSQLPLDRNWKWHIHSEP